MSDSPAVSVIMAVYNGAAWLRETVASLQAQQLGDWELVAVDDCSRDDSVRVLRSFGDPRIRVIESAENGGPVVARNRAMAEARGRYIAALDQDDISTPDRLARQVAYLEAHPGTVLVASAAVLLEDGRLRPGTWTRPLTPVLIDWQMRLCNPLVWSSVMFRGDAARRLNPFERPEMRYVEDFDLYHRLRQFGQLACIDAELTQYRVHAGGASQRYSDTMWANAARLLNELHAPLLGEEADALAPLLVRHVMAREAVPDHATLTRLFAGIARLRADFGERSSWSESALVEVDADISRLWWRTARAALRRGTLRLGAAVAGRPGMVSIHERPGDLGVSRLIGGVRSVRGMLGRR